MMFRRDVRRAHEVDAARIDDDEPGALAQAALHLRTEHRVAVGWVGAHHHDDIGLHDRIEGLGASRFAQRLLQAVTGGRVADAGAGVDIVVAEGGAHQLLHEVGFLVGTTARRDAADRIATMCGLDALEFRRGVGDRLIPADRLPGVRNVLADHRRRDAVRMCGIAEGEAALDARMAVIGAAVLVRHHAHHRRALHLGVEGAADAAVGAGRGDLLFGLTVLDHALFHQRRGRAGLHAGAAGHAFRFHEGLAFARAHAGFEPAAGNGQREGALRLFAGAYAAVADDALRGVVAEVRVGFVLLLRQCRQQVEVVLSFHAVAHFAQADHAGHVLQFAVAVGRAGEAVQRVVGNVELHHAAADVRQLRCLRAHLHAGFGDRRARRRVAAAPFDLDQAQATGAEGFQAVGRAQLRNAVATFLRGAHDRGAGGNGDVDAVDGQRDCLFGFTGRGAVIGFSG